jgi:hypothetical protein
MVELAKALGYSVGRPAPVLAQAGDSRLSLAKTISGSDLFRNMHGVGAWAGPLTNGEVKAPLSYNRAVTSATMTSYVGDGGANAKGIIPADGSAGQLSEILALSPLPSHCLILTGTNDIALPSPAIPLADMKTSMATIIARLLNAGIVPLVLLDLPRGWVTAAYRQKHFAWNTWLIEAAPKLGAVVIDATPVLMDITNANGDPLASMFYDSPALHPSNLGAKTAATVIANYFNELGLSTPFRGFSAGDVYEATNNPQGNKAPNGGVGYGTGGTKTGANITGDVWTGWRVESVSGPGNVTSCVCSVEARSDGGAGNWQKIDLTTSAGVTIWFYPAANITATAGDILELGVDLDVSGVVANVSNVTARIADYNSTTLLATYYAMNFDTARGAIPSAFAGRFSTEGDPMTMLANTTRVFPIMSMTVTGAVTNVIMKVGGVSLRPPQT